MVTDRMKHDRYPYIYKTLSGIFEVYLRFNFINKIYRNVIIIYGSFDIHEEVN